MRKIRFKVQELAQAQGLSEWDLAARSGLGVRVIRRMIKNEHPERVTISQLARIAEALGVATGELIEDMPAPK